MRVFYYKFTAQIHCTINPKSWNTMESSKRPSNYHLSTNLLAEKMTVFPISKKFKTRTFEELINIIFPSTFWFKKRPYFPFPKISKNSLVTSKRDFPYLRKYNLIVFLRTERSSLSFLISSCKFRKY